MAARPHPLQEEIAELKRELWMARQTIARLMPEVIQDILCEAISCDSMADVTAWRRWAVDQIIERANADVAQPFEFASPEAPSLSVR